MLCRKINVIRPENHMNYINTLCGQNGELFYVNPGGT